MNRLAFFVVYISGFFFGIRRVFFFFLIELLLGFAQIILLGSKNQTNKPLLLVNLTDQVEF
jgi:hypothetical protein